MRRYWVPADAIQGDQIILTDDVFHHICGVCRQGLQSRFELIHNQKAHLVEIVELNKKKATTQILETRDLPPLPQPPIHLALSLPRFTTLEKVLEKSVELGVSKLHLFASDFSFMKPKSKDLEKKTERWQKIILGATQQTGRGELMELTPIRPLSVLLEEYSREPGAQGWVAYEGDGTRPFGQELDSWSGAKSESVWIFVGGEGGFSLQDIALFKNSDILPVGLGDQVLRVETACVTLLGILKYHLGHFG